MSTHILLVEDDAAYGKKREMLTMVFEANVELQKKKEGGA